MKIKNLIGWTEIGPYEDEGIERECVMTEVRDRKTIRTFYEYKVIFHGIKYEKNNKIVKVEMGRERFFQRNYKEELNC